MDRRFQTNLSDLPTEIITNILSRLPIRSIINCKSVCKSWFELIKTPEFANVHLSKCAPGLIVYRTERFPSLLRIYEFEDELELDQHELHYVPVATFQRMSFIDAPGNFITMEGSLNGLIFLRDLCRPKSLCICNPITGEYINLLVPGGVSDYSVVAYGFGVSKTTGQYKVVSIYHEYGVNRATSSSVSIPKPECHVYTLGTGLWRSVLPDSYHTYRCCAGGAFLNGNLHWLVSDLKGSLLISCFDLETELFRAFSPPPGLQGPRKCFGNVVVLGDHLCLCDYTSENEIVIWVMKEYGVEKSWTKEFVIGKPHGCVGECYEDIYPIKVFKDGDILLLGAFSDLVYYNNKIKTTLKFRNFEQETENCVEASLHVASFLSLQSFGMENVAKL